MVAAGLWYGHCVGVIYYLGFRETRQSFRAAFEAAEKVMRGF